MKGQQGRLGTLSILRTRGTEGVPLCRPKVRTIAVLSGKGGVGKTTLVVNLALALRRRGRKVLIVDGDFGMGNVDLLFGEMPRFSLHDVVLGERSTREVLFETPDGVHLLAGSSGVEEMANLDELRCERLLCSVSEVEQGMDLILYDTPTGLGRISTRLARSADELVLVTTPEPTSFTNAYACLRALHGGRQTSPPWIMVNQAHDAAEARATAERIRGVARRFLSTEPVFLGYILADPAIPAAVRRQEPVLNLFPDAPASACIERLAQKLMASPDPDRRKSADPRGSRRKVANMEDARA